MPCNARAVVNGRISLTSTNISALVTRGKGSIRLSDTLVVEIAGEAVTIKSSADSWDAAVAELNAAILWLQSQGVIFAELGEPETHSHNQTVEPWQSHSHGAH